MSSLNFVGEGISYKSMQNQRPALNCFLDVQEVTVSSKSNFRSMMRSLLLITAFSAIFLKESFGKPTKMVTNSNVLDPVKSTVNNDFEIETTRQQRSPQFGLLGGYSDDYDYNDNTRYVRYGNRRNHYYKHHRPHGFVGGHGCRGYSCGGGYVPDYSSHHHTGQGASFASASAGSINGGGPYGGGHSQANAQSASFNIGPFSASFSAAQSASG